VSEESSLESLTIARLAVISSTPVKKLWQIARNAEHSYNFWCEFNEGKARSISAPNVNLKKIQSALERELRALVPPAASVYSVRGKGVIKGATLHLSQNYISCCDIKSAFPSVTCDRVNELLLERAMPADTAALIRRLVTVRGSLPQGSPCSNAILDLALDRTDRVIEIMATAIDAKYSRFVDDLVFSAAVPLDDLLREQ
jgi:hypothetical protein